MRQAAGGEVRRTADGKLRVQGIIQVTRTLGDLQLQRHGLTPEPEVLATYLLTYLLTDCSLLTMTPEPEVLH